MPRKISILVVSLILVSCVVEAFAGQVLPFQNSIEITCANTPVQLGFSGRVYFRATCPGIWAITHQRIDEASFRRRFFSYRHLRFVGYWEIKDQGLIEAIPSRTRELFIVLPGDVIEFKLIEPDPGIKIDVTNAGYIKKAGLRELQGWLAYNSYMEKANLQNSDQNVAGP